MKINVWSCLVDLLGNYFYFISFFSCTTWNLSWEIWGVQALTFTPIRLEVEGPTTQEANPRVALTTACRVSGLQIKAYEKWQTQSRRYDIICDDIRIKCHWNSIWASHAVIQSFLELLTSVWLFPKHFSSAVLKRAPPLQHFACCNTDPLTKQ